jgi:hypothetical protein
MSSWLLLSVAAVYLYVAAEQCRKGNYGLALAFFGYAFSNVGMLYATHK